MSLLALSLGRRSCRSRCSFPMICLWMPAFTYHQNDEHITQVLSHKLPNPFHLDNIHAAVANLVSLSCTADNLSKSPKGWIKVAILPTYAGKSVPANFDTNTQEIVSNGILTVASYGVHKPLDEPYCRARGL